MRTQAEILNYSISDGAYGDDAIGVMEDGQVFWAWGIDAYHSIVQIIRSDEMTAERGIEVFHSTDDLREYLVDSDREDLLPLTKIL
jgi:hypothetical protein